MRRLAISGVVLILCSSVLGATVFRERVAQAAQAILPVRVMNTEAQPVPVDVTNGSLTVAAAAPVSAGGGQAASFVGGANDELSPPATATAIQLGFENGADTIVLRYQNDSVGFFRNALTPEPFTQMLALTRPIAFDEVVCGGTTGGLCTVDWIGAEP